VQAVTITKTQDAKLSGEPTTMADLKPIRQSVTLQYSRRSTSLDWQTDHFY